MVELASKIGAFDAPFGWVGVTHDAGWHEQWHTAFDANFERGEGTAQATAW